MGGWEMGWEMMGCHCLHCYFRRCRYLRLNLADLDCCACCCHCLHYFRRYFLLNFHRLLTLLKTPDE